MKKCVIITSYSTDDLEWDSKEDYELVKERHGNEPISSIKGLGQRIMCTRTYQIFIRKAEDIVLSGVSSALTMFYMYDDMRKDSDEQNPRNF